MLAHDRITDGETVHGNFVQRIFQHEHEKGYGYKGVESRYEYIQPALTGGPYRSARFEAYPMPERHFGWPNRQ